MKPLNFYFTTPRPTRLRPLEVENHRKVIVLLQRRGVDNAHRLGYDEGRELLAKLIAIEVREKIRPSPNRRGFQTAPTTNRSLRNAQEF